jgi:hypothetical protein
MAARFQFVTGFSSSSRSAAVATPGMLGMSALNRCFDGRTLSASVCGLIGAPIGLPGEFGPKDIGLEDLVLEDEDGGVMISSF